MQDTPRPASALAHAMRRFARDRRGSPALEFAFIAPIMVLAALGMAELHFQFEAWQRVSTTASQVADLIAQDTQHTTASLNALRTAAEVTLRPLPSEAAQINLDIASVGVDAPGGTARVLWRNTRGPQIPLDLEAAGRIAEPGGSVIWVGVRYTYRSPISLLLEREQTHVNAAFARPRLTRRIALNGRLEAS